MADLINLRAARKAAKRTKDTRTSEQNRIVFGRTKAEKLIAKMRTEKARREIDAHRIEREDG